MKVHLASRGLLILIGFSLCAAAHADTLYKKDGKAVSDKDLSPAMQQALYDIEYETFLRKQHFVDSAVLDEHIESLARKQGKDREAIEQELFKVAEPSDDDAKKWFEENKDRMPPNFTFEQIKNDIKKLLKGEKQKGKRDEVIAKIKKDNKIVLGFEEPKAPVFDVKTAGYPVRGNAKAKVTMVEFADYQCPHCQHAGKIIKDLLKKHDGKFKLVYIDFPINRSGISKVVAHGAVCAREQGKYWEYHDLAFKRQKTLKKDSPGEMAKELKLDEGKFKTCLEGKKPEKVVADGQAEGERLGVGGTPTIFINGRKIQDHSEQGLEEALLNAVKNASS